MISALARPAHRRVFGLIATGVPGLVLVPEGLFASEPVRLEAGQIEAICHTRWCSGEKWILDNASLDGIRSNIRWYCIVRVEMRRVEEEEEPLAAVLCCAVLVPLFLLCFFLTRGAIIFLFCLSFS
ncbi:hypothetical protein V8C42DRAFT_327619 [Trichoderma barbatum]